MSIRRLAGVGVLSSIGLILPSPVSAQPQITSVQIGEGLYVVHSAAGPVFQMNNLLVVDPVGVLLIDTLPPPPQLYLPFNAVIQGLTGGRPVTTIINTSWHYDHVGINDRFVVLGGTETVIGHWRMPEYMTDVQCIEDLDTCMPVPAPESQPTEFVHGEARLALADDALILKTAENAHSGADLFVYLEHANVMYTGDVYFGGFYPIIDRTGGGTINGTLAALRQILARIDDDTIVVPSHGAVGNRQSVLAFVEMLETSRRMVRSLIAAGLTEEEVMVHPSFAELDAQWGPGSFITGPLFRRIVYRDLASREH